MGYREQYEESKKGGQTKSISAIYYEFKKKGDTIIGRLLGTVEVPSKLGGPPYKQYLFDTDTGLIKCALGRATDTEAGALMRPGMIYFVKFDGRIDIGAGRKINKFEVERVGGEDVPLVGGEDDIPF